MELLKDYDYEILYHPGKANVVADALSRKGMIAYMMAKEWNLLSHCVELSIDIEPSEGCYVASLQIEPSLMEQIRVAQQADARLIELARQSEQGYLQICDLY